MVKSLVVLRYVSLVINSFKWELHSYYVRLFWVRVYTNCELGLASTEVHQNCF